MKRLIFGLVAFCGLCIPAFGHEVPKHKFDIGVNTTGGKISIFKLTASERLADVLSENLAAQVKAFRDSAGTEPLVLSTAGGGKATIFDKATITGIYTDDLTPEEDEKPVVEQKKSWKLVCQQQCGRCPPRYFYVYE